MLYVLNAFASQIAELLEKSERLETKHIIIVTYCIIIVVRLSCIVLNWFTCLYEPKNLESRPLEFSFHVELINIEESERINSSERQSKAAMEDM